MQIIVESIGFCLRLQYVYMFAIRKTVFNQSMNNVNDLYM